MADFEKKTTLFDVNVDVSSAEKSVESLTDAILKNKDAASENKKEIKELEKANKDLEKQVKDGTKTSEQANAEASKNKDRIDNLKKSNFALGDELKKLNKERTQAVKVSKLQAGSLDALRNKSAELKKELNSVSTETEEGRKKFEALQKELKKVNDQIVEADQGAGDFKTSVGRYREETAKAIEDSKGFGGALGGLTDKAQESGGRFKQLFNLLKANPLIFLAGILAGLIKAFTELGSSVAFLEPIFAGIDAVIGTVIGRLGKLGGAIVKFVQGDFKGAFEEAKEAVTGLGEEITNSFNKGKEIKELEESVRSLSRELLVTNERLQGQADLFQQIADDATLSFEEQEKAAIKVAQIQEELFQNRLNEAEQNQKIATERRALAESQGKDIRDLLDAERQAQAEKIAIENELTLFRAENATLQRQLAQDVFEQDLDFAIDVGTRRTEEAQRAAENEKLSLEERSAALQEARDLDAQAFETQLALFEQVGLERDKINQLINESNAEVIASELKKTELSEIERNRFRELVLERQALTEGLNATEEALNEARSERAQKQLEDQRALGEKLDELDEFRREQENERLLEAEEDDLERFELELEQLDERFEIKEEKLAEQREIALENENLSNEERLALETDFQLQLEMIQADGAKQRAALQKKIDNEELKKAKEQQKQKKAIQEQGKNTFLGILDAGFQIANNKIDSQNRKETNDLIKQLNSGQITREEFDKKKQDLDRQSAIEAYKVQVKQFNTNKAIGLVETAVNTAKGVTNALGSFPPPASFVMAALVAALGIAQGIAIGTKQPPPAPTFAKGGDVFGFTVGGNLHSQGGTTYVGEDGNRFEVEKDEGIFVTKREATNPALQMLSDVNTKFGGRSMFATPKPFLQEGGRVVSTGLSADDIGREVAEANAAIPPPQVQVIDIMAGIQGNEESENTGVV